MTVKIYLAGSITHHGNPNAWRQNVIDGCRHWGVEWINPLTVEAKTKTDAEVVAIDYQWIKDSHAVLCNAGEPSWGTAMEVAHAYSVGVPVFAFGKRPSQASPWLRHHTDVLDISRNDVLGALGKWLAENGHIEFRF